MCLRRTRNAAVQSLSSRDVSGALGRGSGLQPSAMLGPGKLLEVKAKVLHAQTADAAQRPGEMGQELCLCETTIGPLKGNY